MKIRSAIAAILFLSLAACGGSSDGGGGASGTTLTGTVASFTASLNSERTSLFASLADLLLAEADAAVAGVTVSIGSLSTTTGADGGFSLSNIPTGNQTVVFSEGGSSANYALVGVGTGETFTLENVQVNGTAISTQHTGTWTGTIYSSDIGMTLNMEMTVAGNTNAFTGTASNDIGDVWAIEGTETGGTASGTAEVTAGPCIGDGATFTGTFSNGTYSGTYDAPGGVCNASNGTVELTQQ